MCRTKENYIEIHVGISTKAQWYLELQRKMKRLGVECKDRRFHITALFMKDDAQKDKLIEAFDRILVHSYAPHLTFDKLDVFTSKSGIEHIVNLSSAQPEEEFCQLVEILRKCATEQGAHIEDFRLHVTIAKVPVGKITLEELQKKIAGINFRKFRLALTTIEYRYKMRDLEKGYISGWKCDKTNKPFNKVKTMWDYRRINNEVMTDTKKQYESVEELKEAVRNSIKRQFMVAQEENIDQPPVEKSKTRYVCSAKRSFEAAKAYKGKKTAVLNFANNHSVGGAPFSAGAQEESLCRCSTLLPCLEAMQEPFYLKHIRLYEAQEIGAMGNDDLIYTPDVVVFKTDERTDPVYPKMMEQDEWYKVDVITSAAPELSRMLHRPNNYEEVIFSRVKKILDVAAKEKVEVLILGAWGCGAFKNDSTIVSKAFYSLLKNYNFETVEFALSSKGDVSKSPFYKA